MKKLRSYWFLLILFIAVGCSPIPKIEQGGIARVVALDAGQSVGQTTSATYAGLTGVQVFIDPGSVQQAGELRLHLFSSPTAISEISQAVVPLQAVTAPGYYRFVFPVIQNSNQADYYFTLEQTGSGPIHVGTAPGESYLNGAMYIDGQPGEDQMAFGLLYAPADLVGGLALEGLRWLGFILAAGFLFILPGWALFSALWPGWQRRTWLEKLPLSAAASLAVYPILLLWTYIFGLHLGPAYAWGPPVIALLFLIWRSRKMRFTFPTIDWRSSQTWAALATIVVMSMVTLIRFWVVRTLPAPMWGDSYSHTLIAQLIVDRGGLYESWTPYASLVGITYHFGFHSLVAVFHWVTNLPMTQATLWMGQILNVLAILALYPLAVKIGRSPWAGCVALLAAGLISAFPMFYTNWGRYTQLTGQVILPVAVWMVWEITEELPKSIGAWCLVAIAWAGMTLSHYRVLIVGGCFLVVWFFTLLRHPRQLKRYTGFLITAAVGILILAPWAYHVYASNLMADFTHKLSTPAESVPEWIRQYNRMAAFTYYQPLSLWLISLGTLAAALWKHAKNLLILVLWAGLALLAANPGAVGLPGDSIVSNSAVMIAAYMWTGILAGVGFSYLYEALCVRPRLALLVNILAFVAIAAAGAAFLPARRVDIDPVKHQFFTRADQRAVTWIRENTPPDSIFLTNSLFGYGNTLIAGSDAGYWLPLLTERANTVPPLIYGFEQGPFKDYIGWVNALPTQIKAKGVTSPAVIRMLTERKVTHVFIGQRQGSVNYSGKKLLDPAVISKSPDFKLVYHQDRVWIFALQPSGK